MTSSRVRKGLGQRTPWRQGERRHSPQGRRAGTWFWSWWRGESVINTVIMMMFIIISYTSPLSANDDASCSMSMMIGQSSFIHLLISVPLTFKTNDRCDKQCLLQNYQYGHRDVILGDNTRYNERSWYMRVFTNGSEDADDDVGIWVSQLRYQGLKEGVQVFSMNYEHRHCGTSIFLFVVRSPRFWGRGYCTKWRIQGSFERENVQSGIKARKKITIQILPLTWLYSEWSTSNFPCSLTRNIPSRSMRNLAFHSLLRWKMIVLLILTTTLLNFSLEDWENVRFELGSERVKYGEPRNMNAASYPCWVVTWMEWSRGDNTTHSNDKNQCLRNSETNRVQSRTHRHVHTLSLTHVRACVVTHVLHVPGSRSSWVRAWCTQGSDCSGGQLCRSPARGSRTPDGRSHNKALGTEDQTRARSVTHTQTRAHNVTHARTTIASSQTLKPAISTEVQTRARLFGEGRGGEYLVIQGDEQCSEVLGLGHVRVKPIVERGQHAEANIRVWNGMRHQDTHQRRGERTASQGKASRGWTWIQHKGDTTTLLPQVQLDLPNQTVPPSLPSLKMNWPSKSNVPSASTALVTSRDSSTLWEEPARETEFTLISNFQFSHRRQWSSLVMVGRIAISRAQMWRVKVWTADFLRM